MTHPHATTPVEHIRTLELLKLLLAGNETMDTPEAHIVWLHSGITGIVNMLEQSASQLGAGAGERTLLSDLLTQLQDDAVMHGITSAQVEDTRQSIFALYRAPAAIPSEEELAELINQNVKVAKDKRVNAWHLADKIRLLLLSRSCGK